MGSIAGSALASASAVGGILGSEMEKEGYSKEFSAAVNITSATTGLIIPPSNILIVYSLASGGVSVTALFLAGYIPGILTGLFLLIVAVIWSKKNNYKVGKRNSLSQVSIEFLRALPSLMLLFIVVGGIIIGVFTPTEASAIAVLYSLILSFIYKEISIESLPEVILKSIKTTSVVMLLIGVSMCMSWVLSFENIPQDISSFLINLSDNKIIILLLINLTLLFVGIFMDITPAVLIFTPIFLPVVTSLGMDPIHFGIVLVLNLCIGLCTPPVGSVLFVGVGVAGTTITKVIKPLLPFFFIMIISLLLVTFFPSISLFLPSLFDL